MTKERENEIRKMSREAQEVLLFELRQKYSSLPVAPNQPIPMNNVTKEFFSDNEEIDLLEELLRDSD